MEIGRREQIKTGPYTGRRQQRLSLWLKQRKDRLSLRRRSDFLNPPPLTIFLFVHNEMSAHYDSNLCYVQPENIQ